MSGSMENDDDVGLEAGLDRAALVAGRAEGRLDADALPAASAWKAGMISS